STGWKPSPAITAPISTACRATANASHCAANPGCWTANCSSATSTSFRCAPAKPCTGSSIVSEVDPIIESALYKRFRGYLPVVIDVECGGFNAKTDAILEIAAVLLDFNGDQ